MSEGDNWFRLDQFRGIEDLFFVASPNQRQDIEEILQSITGRERSATTTPQQVTKVSRVPYGVGSIRPGTKTFGLSSGSGQDQTILLISYFEQKKLVRTFASLDASATNKSWQHPMSTRTQGACPSAQNAGTFSGGLLFIISLFVSGCAALPLLIPPIIGWGANLLATAGQNYDTSYKEDLQVLLLVVQDPIASHGGTPYSDNHPQPNTEPISLDVLLAKKHVDKGVPSYLPIRDGDILRDGRGDPQAGDKFRIMFRAKTQCYVYVIAIDGSAWAQGVFPPPGNAFANPVKPGQQVVLPEGPNWFSLDQYQGIETIFFVASQERRPDLEKILTKISGRERHPSEKPVAVTEPAIIPRGFSVAKASRSPFAIQTSQGQKQELIPTTFLVQTAGEALRVTRWFHHQ